MSLRCMLLLFAMYCMLACQVQIKATYFLLKVTHCFIELIDCNNSKMKVICVLKVS